MNALAQGSLRGMCCACLMAGALVSLGCSSGSVDVSGDASVDGEVASDTSLELGTHVQWKQQPEDFSPLDEGSELPIVLGHQGAWMVVLALRSDAFLESPIDLKIGIEAAGSSLGELQLSDHDLDRELDGKDYDYDIWLIVADPSLSTYEATISLEVSDLSGRAAQIERRVLLSGGLD